MEEHEIQRMLGQAEKAGKPDEPTKVKIQFQMGDTVKIKEGAFESFEGTVEFHRRSERENHGPHPDLRPEHAGRSRTLASGTRVRRMMNDEFWK